MVIINVRKRGINEILILSRRREPYSPGDQKSIDRQTREYARHSSPKKATCIPAYPLESVFDPTERETLSQAGSWVLIEPAKLDDAA